MKVYGTNVFLYEKMLNALKELGYAGRNQLRMIKMLKLLRLQCLTVH
jgi:hypothetical protein